jgi:membrane associated rhomboid family serine protease
VTTLTAFVGAAQLLGDGVIVHLQRDRSSLEAGQWWRLVTPMFVQPAGIGQYAFNVIGLLLVGIAVERRFTAAKWLAIYFCAGVGAIVLSYLWFPADTGGGSSDGVAGLIGALTATWWVTRSEPWWPGYLYGTFFAAYTTGLATGGVVVAAAAGSLTVAAVTTIRRHGQVSWLPTLTGVLVAGCAVTLTLLHDGHGVGLLAGILIGLLLRPNRDPSRPTRPDRTG